jgi:hypothetical protein
MKEKIISHFCVVRLFSCAAVSATADVNEMAWVKIAKMLLDNCYRRIVMATVGVTARRLRIVAVVKFMA